MAAMPIYGKNLKKSSSPEPKADDLETWYAASGLKYYQVCSNHDPGLTLTYFTTRSDMITYAFVWEKGKTRIFQKLLLSMI